MTATKVYDLRGQRALVTGAGRGIGEACAKTLAAVGAEVDLNDQWVFIIGGIRNARITTGFSSRVSRPLPGTGRRTSSRATVFCVRRSRARSSPFLNAGFLRTV